MASYRLVNGQWEARVSLGFSPDGKRRTISKRFPLKREAREWANKTEVKTSKNLSLTKTVADLSNERMAYRADEGMSSEHLANVERFHTNWIVPYLGHLKLSKVTTTTLRKWSQSMKQEGLSDNQRRKVINELKATFKQAEAEGQLATDPARHLKPPREPKRPAEALNPAYLPALLGSEDALMALAVRISVDTGMRRSNLLGLRFCDLEGQTLRLALKVVEDNGAKVLPGSKTGQGVHSVIVSEDTSAAIEAFRKQREQLANGEGVELHREAFIISNSLDHGEPMRPSVFFNRWRRTLKALDLPPLQFKSIRHLTASRLLQAGIDPATIAERLGHSVDVLLSTYAHVLPGRESEAASIMSDLMKPDAV